MRNYTYFRLLWYPLEGLHADADCTGTGYTLISTHLKSRNMHSVLHGARSDFDETYVPNDGDVAHNLVVTKNVSDDGWSTRGVRLGARRVDRILWIGYILSLHVWSSCISCCRGLPRSLGVHRSKGDCARTVWSFQAAQLALEISHSLLRRFTGALSKQPIFLACMRLPLDPHQPPSSLSGCKMWLRRSSNPIVSVCGPPYPSLNGYVCGCLDVVLGSRWHPPCNCIYAEKTL